MTKISICTGVAHGCLCPTLHGPGPKPIMSMDRKLQRQERDLDPHAKGETVGSETGGKRLSVSPLCPPSSVNGSDFYS